MCLLIHKPAGVRLSDEILDNGSRVNNDSWGVAAISEGGVWVDKGLDFKKDPSRLSTFDNEGREVLNLITPKEMIQNHLKDLECVLHFRMANVGKVSMENAHPIAIGDSGSFLAHNGTINEFRPDYKTGLSDTYSFASWLGLIMDAKSSLLGEEGFWEGVESILGSWNKAAVISPSGVRLLNEKKGERLENGVWVSNLGWKTHSNYSNVKEFNPPINLASKPKVGDKPRNTIGVYPRDRRVCFWCSDCGHDSCIQQGGQHLKCSTEGHVGACIESKQHENICFGLRSYYLHDKEYYCFDCYQYAVQTNTNRKDLD